MFTFSTSYIFYFLCHIILYTSKSTDIVTVHLDLNDRFTQLTAWNSGQSFSHFWWVTSHWPLMSGMTGICSVSGCSCFLNWKRKNVIQHHKPTAEANPTCKLFPVTKAFTFCYFSVGAIQTQPFLNINLCYYINKRKWNPQLSACVVFRGDTRGLGGPPADFHTSNWLVWCLEWLQ